jgi:caffeoyl-CoA O-methyltransferase
MADPSSRSGARYTAPELLAFVESMHAAHDPGLLRAFEAPTREQMPQIQVSPSEGKFLTLLMRLLHARKVVEVGTLAGYSAIRIARGLADGGQLWSLEIEPHHARVARDNFAAAGVADRAQVLVGDAVTVLSTLVPQGPFDAMFIDADKGRYPEYAHWAAENLRPGGLLIADNSYFFGQLLGDSTEAEAMRAFHVFVAQHFDSACVPTPDGMVLAIQR